MAYVYAYFVSGQNEITSQARKVMRKAIFDEIEPEFDEMGNETDSRSLAEILEDGNSNDLMAQMDAMLDDFGPPRSVD